MKLISILLLCFASFSLFSCAYDNYPEPESRLQGRLVYQGEPINVEYNNVTFELWEPGWQKRIPITVTVGQDGSYSAQLFKATYKLVIPTAQGPFRSVRKENNSDTTTVNLTGNQTLDIDVQPYYMVRTPTFSVASGKVSATCKLEQIITGTDARAIERVSLYVSKTQFVDSRTSLSSVDLAGASIKDLNAISLSTILPTIAGQAYAYARIGVKVAGVEDLIFSPVQKVQP
jgi:hypothetical protein